MINDYESVEELGNIIDRVLGLFIDKMDIKLSKR